MHLGRVKAAATQVTLDEAYAAAVAHGFEADWQSAMLEGAYRKRQEELGVPKPAPAASD